MLRANSAGSVLPRWSPASNKLENVKGKTIALGVCGGIAAYKAVEVARRLTQKGADVRVVMTPSAGNFVGPITFSTLTGNPVRSELFPETVAAEIIHTDLARTSDLILVAPATAKVLAKYAQGISDELMTALLLAAVSPVLVAPAMHTEMWEDEATQANISILISRGVRFVGPDSGPLAGPDAGIGRLAPVEDILQAVDEELARRSQLDGVRLVITAGGTREPIDAVRFIGNRSSGRMGYELAREALRRGAKVTLISGPSHLIAPANADVVRVESALEMKQVVDEAVEAADILIMSAAVSDFRPSVKSQKKLKKGKGLPNFGLEPNDDILAEVGLRRKKGRLPGLKVLVGFCAETDHLEKEAGAKLKSKHLDLIVANPVNEPHSGFDSQTNRALLMGRKGLLENVPVVSKQRMAAIVLDYAAISLTQSKEP